MKTISRDLVFIKFFACLIIFSFCSVEDNVSFTGVGPPG